MNCRVYKDRRHDFPLVAGCSIGQKPHPLHVSIREWKMDQPKDLVKLHINFPHRCFLASQLLYFF